MTDCGKLLLHYVCEFHDLIDDVLWHSWDPIGVNKAPAARNEYEVTSIRSRTCS